MGPLGVRLWDTATGLPSSHSSTSHSLWGKGELGFVSQWGTEIWQEGVTKGQSWLSEEEFLNQSVSFVTCVHVRIPEWLLSTGVFR